MKGTEKGHQPRYAWGDDTCVAKTPPKLSVDLPTKATTGNASPPCSRSSSPSSLAPSFDLASNTGGSEVGSEYYSCGTPTGKGVVQQTVSQARKLLPTPFRKSSKSSGDRDHQSMGQTPSSPIAETDDHGSPRNQEVSVEENTSTLHSVCLFTQRMLVPSKLLRGSAFQRKEFATTALTSGSLKARVVHHHGRLLSGPRFTMYAETDQGLTFLMCAERQPGHRSVRPHYVISADEEVSKDSEWMLGKLRANLKCTQYMLHGKGCNPKLLQKHRCLGAAREELAAVHFRKPGNAPRTVEVALPPVDYTGTRREVRPMTPSTEGLAAAWNGHMNPTAGADVGGMQCLASPPPEFDPQRHVYKMNFHGRVKRASSKNFQLALADRNFQPLGNANELSMQFGRVDQEVFALDVSFPFSPLQAFATALSTFDLRLLEAFQIYY